MKNQAHDLEALIFTFRGMKVMLDSDLANLYGIDTKRLNEQVRRNIDRFPGDFMFQLSSEEYSILKSQIATSRGSHGGRRSQPFVFTENGVAMLSSVINSSEAIQVNISIMRTFTKLRSFLAMEHSANDNLEIFKKDTTRVFKIVFERLDGLEELVYPSLNPGRKKIGLK